MDGCRRGRCLGNPSGTHNLAYTLLPPNSIPTMNSGIPTHNIAMYSGGITGRRGMVGVGVGGAGNPVKTINNNTLSNRAVFN